MDLLQQNKHLYTRAGFGITISDYANPLPVTELVDKLFPASGPSKLLMITDAEWADNSPKTMKGVSDKAARKEMEKKFRARTKDINLLWVQTMVDTEFPLVEKTALFWHGHFATRINNPYYDQLLLHVIRKNALWNFGDMLREVARTSAMLQFLNNRQNKKEHPNENFARELMELFTLGRGHYTETDIKEAARAFTGWTFDEDGNFIFRHNQHDDGVKKFLGKTGNFNGDDILDILLERKQTAVFITQKVYRYFVSDEKTDTRRVNRLATEFYDSHYDIGLLLRKIFTAEWFYDDEIAGTKIKSPVELLTGYQRMLPMRFEKDKVILNLQRALGQYLFNPPNVAGWPGGRTWIDSSSLVIRMSLPEAFFMSKELKFSFKPAEEEMTTMHGEPVNKDSHQQKSLTVGKVDVDWTAYILYWKKYSKEDLPKAITNFLLPVPISNEQISNAGALAETTNIDEYIKRLSILLMALPEYQLA